MRYQRYMLLGYLVIAFLFAAWLHADQLATNATPRADSITLASRWATLAIFTPDYSRVTFTGAPIEVCVEMPEDHSRKWCVPVDTL